MPKPDSSIQSLSHVQLFATSWTAALQVSLSITNSRSLLKLKSIKSVMPSNHLIMCCPLLLLPSIFPSIRVLSSESVLCIRWPKCWFQLQHQSFQWIFMTDFLKNLVWFRFDLLAVQGTLKSLLQNHSSKASILQHSAFFIVQLSHPYMTTGKTIALTRWTFVSKVIPLFLICCLCWSQVFFQGARIFKFHGCSHQLQWFWRPRNSLSLFPLFTNRFATKRWDQMPWP